MDTRRNVFQRFAYSPRYKYQAINGIENSGSDMSQNMTVFSGGDMQAYVNNIKVGNLESVTWSISVEVVGNYVMGRRDAVTYTTGKRVIVGSLVLSQYDRHALLDQVFNIRQKGLDTLSNLWQMDKELRRSVGETTQQNQVSFTGPAGVAAAGAAAAAAAATYAKGFRDLQDDEGASDTLLRGLSPTQFRLETRRMAEDAARTQGMTKFRYSDQLPPFDLTLVGVTKSGEAARCSIFGLQVTQETAGFSQNDLGNSVGMSFTALGVEPWQNFDESAIDIANKRWQSRDL